MYYEIEHYNESTDTCTIIEVDFFADIRRESSGIGSYEYWGCRGYDSGQDYYECDDIRWDRKRYTDEENRIIEEYLSENQEKIENELIEYYNER